MISSVAAGRTVCRSPTTPKSTSSKIGASSSLLTATIVFEVCMPARCWIAPEMPAATYSCGETVLPVWPTWKVCGYPAGVDRGARGADGGAERVGELLDRVEVAAGATTAGDHDRGLGELGAAGRLPRLRRHDLGALGRVGDRRGERPRRRRRRADSSGAAEFGLTVMIGVPLVTFACDGVVAGEHRLGGDRALLRRRRRR